MDQFQFSSALARTTNSIGRRRGALGRILGTSLVSVVLVCFTAGSSAFSQSVIFDIRDVSKKEALRFKDEFGRRKTIVEQYFTTTRFVPLFSGELNVKAFAYVPPASEALLPAWEGNRGHMKFAASRLKDGKAAILHELAHVHAPNQVRFLSEGYSTYLEEMIGNIGAYPTLGRLMAEQMKVLHKLYPRALEAVKLEAFDRVSTQRGFLLQNNVGLEMAIPDGEDKGRNRGDYSYLVSGSFVKYLIHAYGLEKFRALYELSPLTPGVATPADPGRYYKAYGKSLPDFEKEWRNWLATL